MIASRLQPFRPVPALRGLFVLLGMLSASSLWASESNQHPMPRNPSSAKECAICHFRWVDTFFVDGRGTDLVPLQTNQVVGTSEMCFSCHDGSVMDSRWTFHQERGHRTGVRLPADMKIPDNFPLDASGQMQCVTCHSPHGVSSLLAQGASTFLRINNTNSSICLVCHPGMAGDLAGGNHPLGTVTNFIPRVLWNKHDSPETAAHTITCETCHSVHGNQQESLLKLTVNGSALCLTCHADKNPINPDGTRNNFHIVNVAPSLASIPSQFMTNGARLAQDGTISCLTCHKVHQNRIEKHLLVAKVDNQSSFCLNCHSNKQEMLTTQHNLAQKFPDAKNLAGQSVSDSGPCSACHLPHQNARLPASGSDRIGGVCLSCHGPAGLAASTNLFGRGHPVGIPLPMDQSSPVGARPAFNLPALSAGAGLVTCVSCHDPHHAPTIGPLQAGAKFLRAPASSLCQGCHATQAAVLHSKHNLSAATPEFRNVLNQTPAGAGACSACHLVHSPTRSTWAGSLTEAANPADRCRACHRPGGPAEKKMVQAHSHPIDISPQQSGLQTSLPLYRDSSQTNAPGKMSCLTCHDPHRWNPNALASLHPPAEGGVETSFLRLPASPSPALCVNCHPNEAVVMQTEHDLSLFLPQSTNRVGQSASKTGPCGVCHLTHNAPIKSKLWARDLRPISLTTPVVDSMCRSCHSSHGIARSKVPAYSYHPPVTVINTPATQGNHRAFFPLFDPVSGHMVSSGVISCSSCHNIHQWNSRNSLPGSGLNVEGDSNNSFLRHPSAELPCKICHGLDSIFRYQYYHKSNTHQAPDDLQQEDTYR